MSNEPGLTEKRWSLTIEALHKALNQTYQQFLETARTDWERLFEGQDPGDNSTRVRVSFSEMTEELAGIPRAGFARIRTKRINGKVRRHPA